METNCVIGKFWNIGIFENLVAALPQKKWTISNNIVSIIDAQRLLSNCQLKVRDPQTLLSETGDRQFPYSQSQPATPLGDGANHYPSFASNHVSKLRVTAQTSDQ